LRQLQAPNLVLFTSRRHLSVSAPCHKRAKAKRSALGHSKLLLAQSHPSADNHVYPHKSSLRIQTNNRQDQSFLIAVRSLHLLRLVDSRPTPSFEYPSTLIVPSYTLSKKHFGNPICSLQILPRNLRTWPTSVVVVGLPRLQMDMVCPHLMFLQQHLHQQRLLPELGAQG
jgi:hypothetical protein